MDLYIFHVGTNVVVDTSFCGSMLAKTCSLSAFNDLCETDPSELAKELCQDLLPHVLAHQHIICDDQETTCKR